MSELLEPTKRSPYRRSGFWRPFDYRIGASFAFERCASTGSTLTNRKLWVKGIAGFLLCLGCFILHGRGDGGTGIFQASALANAAECSEIDHQHSAWTAILKRWVHDGRVNYAALKREDRADLLAYLNKLSTTCAADYIKWPREQRLAFWINAYNAFTVLLIIDHYPIKSIRKIGFLPGAAFRERFIPMPGLKGEDISLNDIENGTLRADFREPRIHFALVCASVGCPVLSNEAYRAQDLNRQLDEQTRLFLSDTSKNRFDPAASTLYLSPIFEWFQKDFEVVAGTVTAYVTRYLKNPIIEKPGVKIAYTTYDWSLNDWKKTPKSEKPND
jgi:hypothetical protein